MVATLLTLFAMSLAQLGPEPPTETDASREPEVQRIELRGDEEPEAPDPVTGPSAPDRAGATPQTPTLDPGTGGTASPDETGTADDPAGAGVGGTADGTGITTIELRGTPDPASPDGPEVVPPGGTGGAGTSPAGQAGAAPPTPNAGAAAPPPPAAGGAVQQPVGVDVSAIPGLGGTGQELSDAQVIQQQIGELQRQMAANQVYNQQLSQQIQSLQAQLDQIQEQAAADEANRQSRIALLNDATDLLRQAQAQLTTGETDVTGQLTNARASLGQALSLVSAQSGEMESRWIQEALAAVDTSIQRLDNLDLFNARVALGMAIVHADSARAAAMER